MNTWKVILATLVIFGAGVVTGGLLVSYAVHVNPGLNPIRPAKVALSPVAITTPWQQRNHDLLRRMDRELDLNVEQHQQIEKFMTESAQRTETLWKPITPLMRKETQKLHREIHDVLTSDQQKKWDGFPKKNSNPEKRHPATNQPPAVSTNSLTTPVVVPATTN